MFINKISVFCHTYKNYKISSQYRGQPTLVLEQNYGKQSSESIWLFAGVVVLSKNQRLECLQASALSHLLFGTFGTDRSAQWQM